MEKQRREGQKRGNQKKNKRKHVKEKRQKTKKKACKLSWVGSCPKGTLCFIIVGLSEGFYCCDEAP